MSSSEKLSFPGPSWKLRWPTGGLENVQLEVVGFLAILGEDGVKKTSRLASLSWTFCLPRLLPAPHCLLFSERPEEHDVFRAMVAGVQSGNYRDHLTHVAGALFGPMQPFTVRCCEISEVLERQNTGETVDAQYRSHTSDLRARWSGPVVAVNFFGCALTITLFVLSLVFGDGMSLVAAILLSILSSLVGVTNHWKFGLKPPVRAMIPPGDTVIKWPNGSFIVVKCSEAMARELFFGNENINYTLNWTGAFMFLSLCGTIFLMVSVIALANATVQMQLAWACAYVLLNIGHWLASALPRRLNWDFSALKIKEQSIEGGPYNNNYTEALFDLILLTKSSGWLKKAGMVPVTEIWDQWLLDAEYKANKVDSHTGPLISPIFGKGSDQIEGKVWQYPGNWKPKEHWDGLFTGTQDDDKAAQAV